MLSDGGGASRPRLLSEQHVGNHLPQPRLSLGSGTRAHRTGLESVHHWICASQPRQRRADCTRSHARLTTPPPPLPLTS